MDPVLVITSLTLLATLLVPIITTAMNNAHTRKVKRQDLFYEHHYRAIETYIRTSGAYMQRQTSENAIAYGSAYGEIFLYAPQELWPKLEEFNSNLMNRKNPIMFQSQYNEICQALRCCVADKE